MTTYARQFVRSPRSVGQARDFVAARVGAAVGPDRADDIRVCVSELVTNALVHGTPRGRRSASTSPSTTAPSASKSTTPAAPPRTCATPRPPTTNGRGLELVDALADEWGTCDRDGLGKPVWASFEIPGVPPDARVAPA
ncbi:ATP-binding protein [Streptomyces sp. B8F3]|uniref:ATP-binding protein n=1 Tax=unclassified Streptomyces TaxID=2593676 RepID=UPI00325EC22F